MRGKVRLGFGVSRGSTKMAKETYVSGVSLKRVLGEESTFREVWEMPHLIVMYKLYSRFN